MNHMKNRRWGKELWHQDDVRGRFMKVCVKTVEVSGLPEGVTMGRLYRKHLWKKSGKCRRCGADKEPVITLAS